jgi:hypothetical protein
VEKYASHRKYMQTNLIKLDSKECFMIFSFATSPFLFQSNAVHTVASAAQAVRENPTYTKFNLYKVPWNVTVT